jgi:hypothetical protein
MDNNNKNNLGSHIKDIKFDYNFQMFNHTLKVTMEDDKGNIEIYHFSLSKHHGSILHRVSTEV